MKHPNMYHNLLFHCLIKHTLNDKKIGYITLKVPFAHSNLMKSFNFWTWLIDYNTNICIEFFLTFKRLGFYTKF
jgi:hypothetical protein